MIDWRDDYAGEQAWNENHQERAEVFEENKSATVTYFGNDGKKFRVRIRQKPNPIGFTARLPRGRSC